MKGLLERARQLRQAFAPPAKAAPDPGDGLGFDPGSGITQEEQKEIRAEIEKVATGSRIAVDPGMFIVKAAKRGVLFPVLVNVLSLAVLAIGLVVLYVLFQSQETQISRGEDTGTITTEGKLLEEVKKESEAKLQEKNQQINDIQGKLAQIDKQRQDLQSTMDAQVQQKEADLRAAMAAELDAEKARLQKQGLSDQDIQKKLADLETQKNTAFQKDLDAFKAQADAERKRSEAALRDLQARYSSDLATANTERQQVLADSRQREADLQAQLAAQSKEAQAQQAQTQQQLAALSSQKTQEDLVSQQLVGLYSVAQTDIAARDYAHALTSLQAIGAYVNSLDLVALPGMAKRRPVDLFIVDSLTSLVQGEIDKAKTDTSSLVEAANRLADIRTRVADADTQVKAGRLAEAEKQYAQALAVLPEISRSYAFFKARAADAETARQAVLDAALQRAETAYGAGRYADMLSAYRDALGYLPETSGRLDATLANIAASGTAQGSVPAGQKAQAAQTSAAGPLLAQADARLAQGSYADAVASYLQLLQDYPLSAQAPQAVQGASRGVSAMNAAAAEDRTQAARVGALTSEVATLQRSLAASTGELTRVKKAIMDLLGQAGDPERADSGQLMAALAASYGSVSKASSASSSLQAQLDAAQKAAKDSADRAAALAEENRRLQEAVQAAQAQAAQQAQAPGSLSDADALRLKRFDQLVESYKKYASLEGPASGGAATVKTYGYRETFLQSASSVFDGLADRVHNYDQGFLSAGIAQGTDDTLKKVAAIVIELGRQKTPADRKAFFDRQLAAAKDDRGLTDYLRKLQALLPGS
jgi:hypothetical protein